MRGHPTAKASRAAYRAQASIFFKNRFLAQLKGEHETVEHYLARGGKVSRCPPGAAEGVFLATSMGPAIATRGGSRKVGAGGRD